MILQRQRGCGSVQNHCKARPCWLTSLYASVVVSWVVSHPLTDGKRWALTSKRPAVLSLGSGCPVLTQPLQHSFHLFLSQFNHWHWPAFFFCRPIPKGITGPVILFCWGRPQEFSATKAGGSMRFSGLRDEFQVGSRRAADQSLSAASSFPGMTMSLLSAKREIFPHLNLCLQPLIK